MDPSPVKLDARWGYHHEGVQQSCSASSFKYNPVHEPRNHVSDLMMYPRRIDDRIPELRSNTVNGDRQTDVDVFHVQGVQEYGHQLPNKVLLGRTKMGVVGREANRAAVRGGISIMRSAGLTLARIKV